MGVRRKRGHDECGDSPASTAENPPKINAAPPSSTRSRLCTASYDVLVGREQEKEEIETFIKTNIEESHAASLYISGKPGCGKTMTVSQIVESYDDEDVKFAFVNCMTVEPSAIFERIAKEYKVKTGGKDIRRSLTKYFTTSSTKMHVLVLDEIDQLASKGNEILYQLFEWPSMKESRLIVVGIANALDLTDRILPLLCNRGCSPAAVKFEPYKEQELLAILNQRLGDSSESLSPAALKYCAVKIKNSAGDARKALDICRRVLEIRKSRPGESDIKIMISIFSAMEGSTNNVLSALPKLQKLIICHMCSLQLERAIKVTALFKSYFERMQQRKLPVLQRNQFLDAMTRLQSAGIVTLSGRKFDISDSTVTLTNPKGVTSFIKNDVTWSMLTR